MLVRRVIFTHNNNTNYNVEWFSHQIKKFFSFVQNSDSEHEFTQTGQEVRQRPATTDAWRALLRLLA